MGTQILAGATGNYIHKSQETLGDTSFVVTHDTCLEAEKLPVKFKGAAEGCWIYMHNAIFKAVKTKE